MANLLIEPIGKPIVLGPPARAAQRCADIVPWTSSSSSMKQESQDSPIHYHLHPAARLECGHESQASRGPFKTSTRAPPLELLDHADLENHCPVLAWQDNTATDELDLTFPNDVPAEEQIEASSGHQWIVVYVCGTGSHSVGSKLIHQQSDVWTCFGNVMLAKRGQQIMLCRCAAYPQMINIQCASNGCEVVIHDCRCSSEDWCMHLSHEQVCMDSLAGFLLFMLTAASQLLAQFGVAGCPPGATSSSLPPWETSCPETNQWVSQSGARMWDVVFNGKIVMESHCAGTGACPIGDGCHSKSSDTKATTMFEICDGDSSFQPTHMSEACRSPVPLALMDGEPDVESAVIQDVEITRKTPLALCDRPSQLASENAASEAQLCLNAEFSNSKPASIPRKPTSKRASSRPRPQRVHTQQNSCQTFCMDAGESCGARTRESSLACHYDALDADTYTQQNSCQSFRMDAGEKRGARKRESSLAYHYDALDVDAWQQFNGRSEVRSDICDTGVATRSLDAFNAFKAPADLPPVKGKTFKQTASRFYARHRATMQAASVLNWEQDQCGGDQVSTCMTPSFGAKRPTDIESYSSPKEFGVPGASAMALDLDAAMSKNVSAAPEFMPSRSLRPFAISTAKLPSLVPRKGSKAAAWSLPISSPVNIF